MISKILPRRKILAASAALVSTFWIVLASAQEDIAVAARVSSDYVRVKRADGTFEPENFTFGEGGSWAGTVSDSTIDNLKFLDVAKTIAPALYDQGYRPATDPKTTKLLIMVYWGRTKTPDHATSDPVHQVAMNSMQQLNLRGSELGMNFVANPGAVFKDATGAAQDMDNAFTTAMAGVAADNKMRDIEDRKNAALLGYDSWWSETNNATPATPLNIRRQDLISELESSRYFVVLMAYDFQLILKEKKHKLLWETRFSIDASRNAFDQQLAAMALSASRYFGRESKGLVHKQPPQGDVHIGELKSLGEVEKK